MGQETPQDHIPKKFVVYQMPGADAVIIRQNLEYSSADVEIVLISA